LMKANLGSVSEADVEDAGASNEFKMSVLGMKPNFAGVASGSASILSSLHGTVLDGKNDALKSLFKSNNPGMLKACLEVVSTVKDEHPVQYVLMTIFEGCRSDSSLNETLTESAKSTNVYTPIMNKLSGSKNLDKYITDKAAYLLSSIIGHGGAAMFSEDQVAGLAKGLVDGSLGCTEKGAMDAMANLLKCDAFRTTVWKVNGVKEMILKVQPTSASAIVYKSIFCIWMLSFNPEIQPELEKNGVAQNLRDVFATSRVEKVIRIALSALRNCLKHQGLSGEIVEKGTLEVLQQNEYEKWRDAELYDEIREMSQALGTRVMELSNFDRYEKELSSGNLRWGFIHSEKFWAENVMKCEKDEFKAIRTLGSLLTSTDTITLAVACHDIGEFVRLHPVGKRMVTKMGVKASVMTLMAHPDREVAREALLCVQKIMLNKWQEFQEDGK